jgi:hypothetical protein
MFVQNSFWIEEQKFVAPVTLCLYIVVFGPLNNVWDLAFYRYVYGNKHLYTTVKLCYKII